MMSIAVDFFLRQLPAERLAFEAWAREALLHTRPLLVWTNDGLPAPSHLQAPWRAWIARAALPPNDPASADAAKQRSAASVSCTRTER